jgi:3-phenylpropionate/trans-cinnamate dioxygenase ferredoxin component
VSSAQSRVSADLDAGSDCARLQTFPRESNAMSEWVTVAKADEIKFGEFRVADVDGMQIVIFNLDGEYYAIEDVCTHDGGQLTGGTIEGAEIVCPRHGARFCIKTGAALTAPAYEAVATFPIKVENGNIFVKDDRWD